MTITPAEIQADLDYRAQIEAHARDLADLLKRTIGMIGMWCESLAELEPILLAESKAAAWIARHTASEGQAARWRESGFAPGARVEWICEGVRIAGTITDDGRVALDEPAHGESHLRLTSAWRVA